MGEKIFQCTLANGLLVLLKEIHTAPLISQWIWYRVGSRNETAGKTGLSHWVEHMQFKGTPRFPAGVLDRAIAREGGFWNAMTYLDWTTYYEILPADKIGLALELEADRMINTTFVEADVESERNVIISERQGSENEPLFRLGEAVQKAAFQRHPYQHDIVGEMADLHAIQADDLRQHYRTFYAPNNAVLALAGDFACEDILERVRKLFEPVPPGAALPDASLPELPQEDERRVVVEGPGETAYVELAYRAPQANHPDFLPFLVLDSLLSGASSINLFGGGISNKTSRLYQALVEGELAVSVSGGLGATIDPFLYGINLTLRPGCPMEKAVEAVEKEIQSIQAAPPPQQEIQRAVKQARALFAYGSETISNQALWLGFSQMFADYVWFTSYLERLAAVTPEQVQRIAQLYLRPHQRVLGFYKPTEDISQPVASENGL